MGGKQGIGRPRMFSSPLEKPGSERREATEAVGRMVFAAAHTAR